MLPNFLNQPCFITRPRIGSDCGLHRRSLKQKRLTHLTILPVPVRASILFGLASRERVHTLQYRLPLTARLGRANTRKVFYVS